MNSNNNENKRDPYWAIAISGFVGASGPSLCQLIALTQRDPFDMPHFNFFLGMFLLGGLGSGIALIAKETVAWKAFTQGLAAPSIFSSTATVAVSVALFLGPIEYMAAYADPPPEEVVTVDSVDVTVEVKGGKQTNIITGDRVYRVQQQQTIRVPLEQRVMIEDGESQTSFIPTKDTNHIKITFEEQKSKGGFLQGLLPFVGGDTHQKLAPRKMQVEKSQEPKPEMDTPKIEKDSIQ